MMEEFLAKNNPSILFIDEPIPHMLSGQGLGSGSSVMGA